MIFSSIEYIVFFPIVFALALILRGRPHSYFLIAASLIFYGAWNPPFIFLLLATVVTDFFAGLQIHRAETPGRRRMWMWLSVSVNLGLLGFFKYANFFSDAARRLAEFMGGSIPVHVLEIVLPAGISFYTFQSMSYTLDVYFGRETPTRSFLDFTCYLSFFPQLVAGPICRSQQMIPQFQRERVVGESDVREGLRLFTWGFIKKVFVADSLGFMIVDPVFANPGNYGTVTQWLAVVAYAGQIYGDFSGYTDMGRGTAKLLGVTLPLNFNFPYLAVNPRDYWRRHHISLSTWLRDYLFLPLGGVSRRGWVTSRNVMITFLLGGLWHGANWTFAAWGLFHGFWLIGHAGYRRIIEGPTGAAPGWSETGWYTAVARLCSFAMILISFVFFRSQNFHQAILVFKNLAGVGSGTQQLISGQVLLILSGVAFTHLWSLLPARTRYLERVPAWVKDIGYGLLIVYVFINMIGGAKPFIYFQF